MCVSRVAISQVGPIDNHFTQLRNQNRDFFISFARLIFLGDRVASLYLRPSWTLCQVETKASMFVDMNITSFPSSDALISLRRMILYVVNNDWILSGTGTPQSVLNRSNGLTIHRLIDDTGREISDPGFSILGISGGIQSRIGRGIERFQDFIFWKY
jgi:hypothetical protein